MLKYIPFFVNYAIILLGDHYGKQNRTTNTKRNYRKKYH